MYKQQFREEKLKRQERLLQLMNQSAKKENFLPTNLPFIPIPCERIQEYVKFDDYETNCIKKIQTIGALRQIKGRFGEIVSINKEFPDKNFPVSFLGFSTDDFYVKLPNHLRKYVQNTYSSTIFETNYVYKVFGIIRPIEGKLMIDACFVKKIEEPEESKTVLSLGSRIARYKYNQIYIQPTLKEALKNHWLQRKQKILGKRKIANFKQVQIT